MQNDNSPIRGARTHRQKGKSVLSTGTFTRGRDLKRYVRSAAALNEIYDDVALSEAISRTRNTLGKWWAGVSRPDPEALVGIAEATGLSVDELTRFVYYNGPPPSPPTIRGLTPTHPLTPEDLAIAEELSHGGDASDSTRRSRSGR